MNIVDEIFQRAAAARPAVVSEGRVLTYGDLLERVTAAADWLVSREGIRWGGAPRVGLACANGVDYIVLALAILKAGGCLVPIADELKEAEKHEIIARTGLCGIVMGQPDGPEWLACERVSLENEAEFSALDPAFIRFSSGTTGRSKGVVLSHRKLRERIVAANAALEIGPSDRVLWMLPMAHHFAVSIVLYLYHGACTVLSSSHLAAEVLATAETTRATVIYGAPFHYSLLATDLGGYAWPDLRLAVATAAALSEEIAQRFHQRFGKPLVQGLGIIEIGLPLLNTAGAHEFPTAVGFPLTGFEVELRCEQGIPVARGNVGEMWIKGPGMFDAYLSPWQTVGEICVAGWFATGDLAAADTAGRITLKGRKKSVLNVGGMKVFPEEVEAILENHPSVGRSRVAGFPHAMLGTVPVAEVILQPEATLTSRELIDWCRTSLSIYKVPVRVKFVDELALTASGKVRRG